MKILGKVLFKIRSDSGIEGIAVDCREEENIRTRRNVDKPFVIFCNNSLKGYDPEYIQPIRKQFKYRYTYYLDPDLTDRYLEYISKGDFNFKKIKLI